MSQREPSIQEVLGAHFDYRTSNMYTAIPGIVVSVVDLGQMYVNVQPSINVRSQDGDDVSERPAILNVPLHMPLTKEGGLSYPISVGTPVFLMFSMRGLDIWKRSNGYPTTPSGMRKFDIRDCVAMPGFYPMSESPNSPAKHSLPHDPSDVVLVHNIGGSEVEVRLKTNGDVEITSPTQVVINAPENTINGNTTINGDFTVLAGSIAMSASSSASMSAQFNMTGDIILNGKSVDNHVHGGVVSGGDDTDPFNA